MDINIQIIENVKKYPQLYQRNINPSERQQIWQRLADLMKLNEQFLKSRWYILRERYTISLRCNEIQTDEPNNHLRPPRNNFKYAAQLEFLKKYINAVSVRSHGGEEKLPHNWIKPEFVITEADLQWKPENETETEEIYFLTTEEEEHTEEDDRRVEGFHDEEIGLREQIEQSVVIEEEIPYESTTQIKSNCDSNVILSAHQRNIKDESAEETPSKESSTDIRQELKEKENIEETEIKLENIPIAVDDLSMNAMIKDAEADNKDQQTRSKNKVSEASKRIEETTSGSQEKEVQITKTENDRCEDAIFGELVAAMLRTIEPNKKKAIKKEIMNLLLS